ncbi:MAG TPA: hypothetical protein DEF36_03570 [Desulfotomaculum sp.]|nr:hypothetical protein [Desulfotomaculum sp.]
MCDQPTKGCQPESGSCSIGEARDKGCCPAAGKSRICADGERYVKKQMDCPPKKAVLSCEGSCIKGEVTRVAANILAYRLQRDSAVRICLGDASTGNSGMFDLIRQAPEIIALEGCNLHCGTEIMKMRDPNFRATIVETGQFYSFDREKYFEIFDLPRSEIDEFAGKVAEEVQNRFFKDRQSCGCKLPTCGS